MIKDGFFPTIIYAEDFKLDTNQLAQNIIQWSKEGLDNSRSKRFRP